MKWEVEYTSEFGEWWEGLSELDQDIVAAAVTVLEETGPTLGRPLVDRIKRSKHHQMKELRPPATNIRVLFIFDPRRTAILLVGGDKTNQWEKWYEVMIPIADEIFDQHLYELQKEGEI